MKTVILHIGPHKTASTYIQKKLLENKEYLLENKWEYSESGMVYLAQHELAMAKNLEDFSDGNLWDQALSTDNNLILSSENFDLLDSNQIEVLAGRLSNCNVKIIYLYRRGDEKLISAWQESIKHGGVTCWSEFFYSHALRPYISDCLGDLNILDRYKSIFGDNSLNIIDYDIAMNKKEDLFELFVNFLDISLNNLNFKNEVINKTSEYFRVEILRRLNILDISKGNKPFHFLREKYFKYVKSNDCIHDGRIHQAIKETSESFDSGDSFLFTMLRKQVYLQYESFIVNSDEDFTITTYKHYQLPRDIYLNNVNVVEDINILYENVIAYP